MSKQIDMLTGSLWTSIPRFALPVAATSILEQLATFVGVLIVGRCSGAQSTVEMAALGSNMPLVSLIVNLSLGISLGANVVIAIGLGRKDAKAVEAAVHTSMALSAIGLLFTLIGELTAVPLLEALLVPQETFAATLVYWRIYLVGVAAVMLYNFEAAVYRSIGVTTKPLRALVVSTALNIVLGVAFVGGLGMGVAGIAVATVISYCVSAGILMRGLCTVDSPVRVSLRKIRIDAAQAAQVFKVGLPAGVQMAIFAVANIVIQGAVNSLGTSVIAASSAALALEFLFWAFVSSFGQACTTFTGQNFGAGNLARCKKALLVSFVESEIAVALLVAAVLLAGREMIALFNSDPQVMQLGFERLYIIVPAYFFSMVYEMSSDYLRGFGISVSPAVLTVLGVCGTRLLWVAFVFQASPTFETIMYVYPVSLGATALLLAVLLLIVRPTKTQAKAYSAGRPQG